MFRDVPEHSEMLDVSGFIDGLRKLNNLIFPLMPFYPYFVAGD